MKYENVPYLRTGDTPSLHCRIAQKTQTAPWWERPLSELGPFTELVSGQRALETTWLLPPPRIIPAADHGLARGSAHRMWEVRCASF